MRSGDGLTDGNPTLPICNNFLVDIDRHPWYNPSMIKETDMFMKQQILEYIDSAIEECDQQIEHAFKPENILEYWAEIQINSALGRKFQLAKFRALFDCGSTPKGKVAFESYSKIMTEAVDTIVSFQD